MMMKKMYTMLMMAMMAMSTCLLTSCEDDGAIAYTLEGTWKGNMYVSSEWNGREYDATRSEITFLRDPYEYSSGTGYWVDYYDGGYTPWRYIANHISWTVNYGTIHIYFEEERVSVEIYDYHLDDDVFSGWFRDGGNSVEFRLYHTSSPNWRDYDRWGYDDWDYYSWSRTRGEVSDTTSVENPKRVFKFPSK